MTEPQDPQISIADSQPEAPPVPFEPASRQQFGGRGCAWMAGIGCVVLLLAGVSLVAAVGFNGDRILAWSLTQFENQITAEFPDGIDDDERRALTEAFEAARESIRAGQVDPQALQGFQSIMFELAFKPHPERTADDYRRLRRALGRLADPEGTPPPGPGDAPAEPEADPARPLPTGSTAEVAMIGGPRAAGPA